MLKQYRPQDLGIVELPPHAPDVQRVLATASRDAPSSSSFKQASIASYVSDSRSGRDEASNPFVALPNIAIPERGPLPNA